MEASDEVPASHGEQPTPNLTDEGRYHTSYEMPYHKVTTLREKVDKLNKQIERINKRGLRKPFRPIDLQVQDEPTRVLTHKRGNAEYAVPYHSVSLTSDPAEHDGWTFVARILHGQDDQGRPLNTLIGPGGHEIPQEFRSAPAHCAHCNMERNRKDTFLVYHPDRGYVQCGSNCLQALVGTPDPQAFASMLQVLHNLHEDGASDDDTDPDYEAGRGRGGEPRYTQESVAYLSAAVTKLYGYVSRQKAMDTGREATADLVRTLMSNQIPQLTAKFNADMAQLSDEDKEEITKTAEGSLAWAKSLVDNEQHSDYEWNLTAAANNHSLDRRQVGIIASAPAAWHRHQQKEQDRAEKVQMALQAGDPRDVYKEGDRTTIDLTMTSVNTFSGAYGPTYIYSFKDKLGHTVKWFASKEQHSVSGNRLVPGDNVTITATVKGFQEYKGVPEVMITKGKVVG